MVAKTGPTTGSEGLLSFRELYRGLIRAERADGPGASRQQWIALGRTFVKQARRLGWVTATKQRPKHRLGNSGEHHVEHAPGEAHVTKHTKKSLYGYVPFLNDDGKVALQQATVREYIQRVKMQHRIFKNGLHFEGVHEDRGGLTFSQPFHHGVEPVAAEIEKYMGWHGYHKVDPGLIAHEKLVHSFYFNPVTRHLVGDARAMNFRAVGGKVVPLDLIMMRVRHGTELHRTVMKGIGR